MKLFAHFIHLAMVLALACAPFLLHLAIWAPALVAAGHNGMAVLSLMGAAVWFGLWLQALPVSRRVPRCTTCAGRQCSTPDACQLPIARATRPPLVAFLLASVLDWLRRPVTRLQLRLQRFELACLRAECAQYEMAKVVGPVYLHNSYEAQLRVMTRIRELEERL